MKRVYDELNRIIKSKTPGEMNPVDILIQIIPMSKEAAYRRLRGEIDFSLEEVVRITRFYDISLEGLITSISDQDRYSVQMICEAEAESAIERYRQTLIAYINLLKTLKMSPNPLLFVLTDLLIPVFPIYKFETLAKFYLYKWLHRWDNDPNPLKMKDLTVPDDIFGLHRSFVQEMQDVESRLICPPELILAHVREVSFLYKMNLLTAEEVKAIKVETSHLLDLMEQYMTRGKTRYDIPFSVYLSHTGFDSTYIYYQNDNFEAVSAHMFGDGFYYFKDQRIIEKMKSALEVLIKNATMITVSGERQRLEFMQRQREMLNTL